MAGERAGRNTGAGSGGAQCTQRGTRTRTRTLALALALAPRSSLIAPILRTAPIALGRPGRLPGGRGRSIMAARFLPTVPMRPAPTPTLRLAAPLIALALCAPAHAADAPAAAPATPTNEVTARAAAEPGAQLLPSGVVVRVLREGKGASPVPTDRVRVHYRGQLTDGTEFDSSYQRGEPAEFPLSRVIRCWTEGVSRLKVGSRAVLTCPPATAYGARGAGGVIPPNATLRFEVELLSIVR